MENVNFDESARRIYIQIAECANKLFGIAKVLTFVPRSQPNIYDL